MSLISLRQQIDALDGQILEWLNRRAELAREVGEIKRQTGVPVYAPDREETMLNALEARNAQLGGRLPASAVRGIYREVMSASYALERGLVVACLGPAGTYSHEAARGQFGTSVDYAPLGSIAEVFAAVEKGKADLGVVPIENSTEGSVTFTLDEFVGSELKICAEILLRVRHNLLSKSPREAIRKIYSHPQSLAQCRQWLGGNFPLAEQVATSSNTRAAQQAVEEPGAAAIAGRLAAELYGLDIVEESIEDSAFNTTRFLVIGRQDVPPAGRDKTSLLFFVSDQSGTLFSALEPFQRLGISMSKIESRPSRRKAWEYCFYVDIAGHAQDPLVARAIAELEKNSLWVKNLGSYPVGRGV